MIKLLEIFVKFVNVFLMYIFMGYLPYIFIGCLPLKTVCSLIINRLKHAQNIKIKRLLQ